MIISIPCKFGEKALCRRMLVFCGVDWFRWSSGMEYTYFFETGDSWHETDFCTGDGAGMSKYIEVDNVLLSSFVLREKGFPFRGEGYVEGFRFKNGKTYAHILCETFYFSHHCVESDEKGYCVPGGNIIFQANWSEKQIDAILSKRGGKGHEGNIS